MTYRSPSRDSLVSNPSASLAWMMTCKPEDSRGGLFLLGGARTMIDIFYDTRVVVVMTRNVFPWQNAPTFEATFEHGPSGPGDTYFVRLDDGRQVHLNGNSSEFVAIYPAETQEKG